MDIIMDKTLSTPSKIVVTNEKMNIAKATIFIDMTGGEEKCDADEEETNEREDSLDGEKFIKRKSKRKKRLIVESSDEEESQGEINEL